MKNVAAAACALAAFVLLHEGGHALLGAVWSETVGSRTHFWGLAWNQPMAVASGVAFPQAKPHIAVMPGSEARLSSSTAAAHASRWRRYGS
jgi:hypothetical protein